MRELLRGRLEIVGPVTARGLADSLGVPEQEAEASLHELEAQGVVLRGAFTPGDTAATAAALEFYAIGLVGYSVVRIASPTFYALNESRTPVKVKAGPSSIWFETARR